MYVCMMTFRLQFSEFGSTESFRVVYAGIMYTVVTFVLPFLVLTIFSLLLIRVYRAQRRRRATLVTPRGSRTNASTTSMSSTTASDEHSVTRVIVVVMVVFGVCNLPAKGFDIMDKDLRDCGTFLYVASRLCHVLEVANSTANFIVYCVLRHQFRDGLRRALNPLQRYRQCRRLEMDSGEERRGARRARSRSPVDVERIHIGSDEHNIDVDNVPHSRRYEQSLVIYENTV